MVEHSRVCSKKSGQKKLPRTVSRCTSKIRSTLTALARAAVDEMFSTAVTRVGVKCTSFVRMKGCGVVVPNRLAAVRLPFCVLHRRCEPPIVT